MARTLRRTSTIVGAALVAALVAWLTTTAVAPKAADAQLAKGSSGPWTLSSSGVRIASFTSCTGFGSANQVFESAVLNELGQQVIRQRPDELHNLQVTCDRPFSRDMQLYQWRLAVEKNDTKTMLRNVTFSYIDPVTLVEVQRWNVTNAWPSELVTAFDREVVTFGHDGAVRGL